MRRKSITYVLMLILLLSLLPAAATAQGEAPTGQPTAPLQIEVLTPAVENKATDSEAAKDAVPGTSLDGLMAPNGMGLFNEVEPNGTPATANALPSNDTVVLGNIYPNADQDYFSFTANAGDRVYAATMTSVSSNGSTDSELRVYASDGTTLIEFDDQDGSLGSSSSSIAGATLPSAGTYYLRVNHFSATTQLRPYHLHLKVQSGAPTPEVEGNDTPATANPLPANGWVSGARNPAAATEQDWYSFAANAGDTVYLGLDLDPERDLVTWNGRLGIALFGDASNQILVVDDANVTSPNSEAMFMTVKAAGTYYAFVDSATAATGGPTATYNLSVAIQPAVAEGVNCTTYSSMDSPITIGPGAGLVSSNITVPGNPRIADLDVSIQLDHTVMTEIDAHLRSPAGNDNGLFTDIGSAVIAGQNQMDITFDDEAAIPPSFTVLKSMAVTPELAYRLAWFDGENAGGTWTLDLRDDVANTNGGTLTRWSITVCEPPPPPVCPAGYQQLTVFSTDFEANNGGFTHSGTADEWQWGTPAFAPITTCNSGVSCWKTDLTGTYNLSSSQDLLSPAINLSGLVGPVTLSWAQRYQIEIATFDHAYVQVQQAGGANPRKLWEWLDATMTDAVGNPAVTIDETGGWGLHTADISSYAGQSIEALFHLDSDDSVQLAGLAIDDLTVTACEVSLAVTLASFDAVAQTDHVLVTWETVSELNSAGFNLYRSATEGGERTLLGFVPSQAPGGTGGAAYSYTDAAVAAGETTWYWLEAMDLSGATTLHGPVSATLQTPTAVTLTTLDIASNSPLPIPAGLPLGVLPAAASLALGAAYALRRRK